MQTIRVFFSKRDRAKYISHLDMARCMTRAFARTDIPIWFTEGFNPHVYMTFSLPIPLGIEGMREAFDFKLTQDDYPMERVKEQLNSALPPDIRVLEAAPAVEKPEVIAWADYRVELFGEDPQKLLEDWERFLAQPEILVTKKTKHLTKEVDLRPMTQMLGQRLGENCLELELRLAAGGTVNLNPNLLLGAFYEARGGEAEYVKILRTAILQQDLREFA